MYWEAICKQTFFCFQSYENVVKSLPSIILYSSTLVGLANKDAMEFSLEDNQRCSESFDGSGML